MKKVFLATDKFIQTRDFYVVANDEDEAEDSARSQDTPYYLSDDLHWSGVEIEQEMEVTRLVSRSSGRHIRLILASENERRYLGYPVGQEEVSPKVQAYSRARWEREE